MAGYLEQYKILFGKAIADLAAARLLHVEFEKGNHELDIDVVYFHMQQSAEKFLKAILSKHKVNFPKTHDLEALLRLAEINNIEILINEWLLIELNDFAVEGRYAVIHDNLENISEYFELLQALKELTDKFLN